MPATSNVPLSGNQDIDGVLSGIRWASGALEYSFPTSANLYPPGYGSEPLNNFAPLLGNQVTAVRTVLAQFASVANLSFTEITETNEHHATLRYARSNAPATAWAYYPANDSKGAGGD